MTKPERCAENVRCWAAEVGFPLPEIREAREGRCYLDASNAAYVWLRLSGKVDPWSAGIKRHRPWGIKSAVCGWRERRTKWAAQIIEHSHHEHGCLLEIDFDRYNLKMGAAYEVAHLVECVWHWATGKKTDPFRVAKERGWEAA